MRRGSRQPRRAGTRRQRLGRDGRGRVGGRSRDAAAGDTAAGTPAGRRRTLDDGMVRTRRDLAVPFPIALAVSPFREHGWLDRNDTGAADRIVVPVALDVAVPLRGVFGHARRHFRGAGARIARIVGLAQGRRLQRRRRLAPMMMMVGRLRRRGVHAAEAHRFRIGRSHVERGRPRRWRSSRQGRVERQVRGGGQDGRSSTFATILAPGRLHNLRHPTRLLCARSGSAGFPAAAPGPRRRATGGIDGLEHGGWRWWLLRRRGISHGGRRGRRRGQRWTPQAVSLGLDDMIAGGRELGVVVGLIVLPRSSSRRCIARVRGLVAGGPSRKVGLGGAPARFMVAGRGWWSSFAAPAHEVVHLGIGAGCGFVVMVTLRILLAVSLPSVSLAHFAGIGMVPLFLGFPLLAGSPLDDVLVLDVLPLSFLLPFLGIGPAGTLSPGR